MFIYNLENYTNICLRAQLCPTFTWVTTNNDVLVLQSLYRKKIILILVRKSFSASRIYDIFEM